MASSTRDLSTFVACDCSLRIYEELALVAAFGQLRPRTYMLPGPQHGLIFDLDHQSRRAKLHHAAHVMQQARCAPPWAPEWLPLWLRAWWGAERFWEAYQQQHQLCGFLGNPFELEARRAEDPTLVIHDDDREPPPLDDVTPGPRPPKKGAP
jgi:hypothetical protein